MIAPRQFEQFNKAVEACRITESSFNHHLMVKTTPRAEKGGQGGQGVTSSNVNKKRKQPWNNHKSKKGGKAPKGKECPKCGKNHGDRLFMAGQNVCYTCGKPGHFSRECPQNTEQSRPRTQGRVFAITREEARKSPEMIQE
ncbi:replication protein A 70 kDa DNA-binding subunit C-like [Neltuma alba]|uniref:replication protein A 70 kDa DNA-binding subunit C-like n=1 Tax=Neltuma alba TaxID=207710 RepID=UPI0010A3FE0D|nr:replication protein A 70 kDa DNA-binding subunit C-like [Prosopis alba]